MVRVKLAGEKETTAELEVITMLLAGSTLPTKVTERPLLVYSTYDRVLLEA